MGVVIMAALLIGGTSVQLSAYKVASINNPNTTALNTSAYETLDEVNESMQGISSNLQQMTEAQNSATGWFSIFQLIPSVMINIPLALLSLMISVPMFLFHGIDKVVPWMPGWISITATLLLMIFVGIKLYHSIRGTGEV